MAKESTYENKIAELEGILEEIESETVPIDILTAKVKRAALLIAECKKVLKKTEQEVQDILGSMDENE